MDAARLILVAAAALVLAIPVAHAQDDEEAVAAQTAQARGPAKPWKFVRGLGRILDLSKPPVVIDEPGLYAIQRNWQLPATTAVSTVIQITADQVTLDLHGFSISADAPAGLTILVITGSGAEIRNGRIAARGDGTNAVAAETSAEDSFAGPHLHRLSLASFEQMSFDANGTTISDSTIGGRGGILLAGSSNLERNLIQDALHLVVLRGDGNRVTDNRMHPVRGRGLVVLGNGNVVANNVMDATNLADAIALFDVQGDHNVLRNNTTVQGRFGLLDALWLISGTGNTLDGNIGAPTQPFRARIGMLFTADGNYYGNNRMAAEVPFALGGTVQVNWGGNVGY